MAAARRISRRTRFGTPPARVWAAIGDPTALGRWLGLELDVDLRPGSTGTAVDADGTRLVEVTDVVPGRRLVLTWWALDADDPPSRVTLDLAALPDGCELTVVEAVVADLGDEEPAAQLSGAGR